MNVGRKTSRRVVDSVVVIDLVRLLVRSGKSGQLHGRVAGQLLLSQAGGSGVGFSEGLQLAAADHDDGRVDDGQGGRTRQRGADAGQVPADFLPVLPRRMRPGADRMDTQERRRLVRTRLLRHIVFETLFSGHIEVSTDKMT